MIVGRLHSFLAAVLIIATTAGAGERPRLVVVISIDQLRQDYLFRFEPHFGGGGFRYLMGRGAVFANASFKHASTITGPGHATIATGAYANQHGITTNAWYDPEQHRYIACVSDETVSIVGGSGKGASPLHLVGSTIGDELRLHTGLRSRVISVSHKDRSAILLGGKLANGAFWMRDSVFVTSTYYAASLPAWARSFNESGLVNSYFGKTWDRALPLHAYASLDADDVPYEDGGNGLGRTFPRTITGSTRERITPSYYSAMLASPFGNEILAAFAKQAVQGERLGQRGETDLLLISFSSNDYVGHAFGPHSHEVFDMTIRTDRILEDLLRFLAAEVGLQNCLIVLTSDHGAAPIPEYLRRINPRIDAGRVRSADIRSYAESTLTALFGKLPADASWIEQMPGPQIYLNRDVLRTRGLHREAVAAALAGELTHKQEITAAYSASQLWALTPVTRIEGALRRSGYPGRHGDVLFVLKPFCLIDDDTTGTSHGTPYEYDAHVPLLLAGAGIKPGRYLQEASPADIAPTLAAILRVEFPGGRGGRVLDEALTK